MDYRMRSAPCNRGLPEAPHALGTGPDTPQGDSLSVLSGVYALSGLIGLKSHSLGPRE